MADHGCTLHVFIPPTLCMHCVCVCVCVWLICDAVCVTCNFDADASVCIFKNTLKKPLTQPSLENTTIDN
jgi:hypothetical protein